MKLIFKILISAFAVYIAAKLIPGIYVKDLTTALIIAVVFGALNTFVKPILTMLTLPLTILTLGLFYLFINALLVFVTSLIVPGFGVYSWLSALLFSIIVSLISSFLSALSK
jgi:putative membrane protein